MRFMLRCIFWLSIVYASILSNAGGDVASRASGDIADAARTAIAAPMSAVAREAATGLSAYCGRKPSTCLADSARLTALVAASGDARGDEPTAAALKPPLTEKRYSSRGAMQARMP